MDDNKTLLCVAVGVEKMSEALELVERESRHADLIEVRLDNLVDLKKIDYQAFFTAASVPLLFTLRPDWEGGYFSGPEAERIDLLTEACESGASYIDCELRAPAETRRSLRKVCGRHGTKLILSYHDFSSTPPEHILTDALRQMSEEGANIGKIVTLAENYLDVLRVLALQIPAQQRGLPLTAFCMGSPGVISRVATVKLGGFMTYCAADSDLETAPGQLTADKVRTILDNLE